MGARTVVRMVWGMKARTRGRRKARMEQTGGRYILVKGAGAKDAGVV